MGAHVCTYEPIQSIFTTPTNHHKPPKNYTKKQDYLAHSQRDLRARLYAALLPPPPVDAPGQTTSPSPPTVSLRWLYHHAAAAAAGAGSGGNGKGLVVQGAWPEAVVGLVRDQCEVRTVVGCWSFLIVYV